MKSWIRFLFWVVAVPTIGILALSMFVMPFVLVLKYHQEPGLFVCSVVGAAVMFGLFAYLDDKAT